MSTTSTTQTLTERVFHDLRSDIVNGRLSSDSPLKVSPLAARFNVSMSVVRESLVRLSEQGLATLSPNQGFRVVSISAPDLIDLTDLRVRLEGLALAESIASGDAVWESRVVATHHILDRLPFLEPDNFATTEEWSVAHAAFHDALGAGCNRPRLIALTRSLRDSSEVYRQLSGSRGAQEIRDIRGEHLELRDLAISREADKAVAALGRHLQTTTNLVLASL